MFVLFTMQNRYDCQVGIGSHLIGLPIPKGKIGKLHQAFSNCGTCIIPGLKHIHDKTQKSIKVIYFLSHLNEAIQNPFSWLVENNGQSGLLFRNLQILSSSSRPERFPVWPFGSGSPPPDWARPAWHQTPTEVCRSQPGPPRTRNADLRSSK